jgi:hypothetical protein
VGFSGVDLVLRCLGVLEPEEEGVLGHAQKNEGEIEERTEN